MAVAPGWYGLTLEKFLIDTLGDSLEAEDGQLALVTNTYAPNFDTHDFHADLTNEVTGTGYTAGGVAVTSTEITLSSGVLMLDAADTVFATVTIADAEAGALMRWTTVSATSELVLLSDFTAPASATAANLTVQWAAGGIGSIDYQP
jgi:hypothetical protein